MNGLLVFSLIVTRCEAMVAEIAGKWFVVSFPGLKIHAQRSGRMIFLLTDEKMGQKAEGGRRREMGGMLIGKQDQEIRNDRNVDPHETWSAGKCAFHRSSPHGDRKRGSHISPKHIAFCV